MTDPGTGWTYQVFSGWMLRPDGSLAGIGYSGFEDGRNNPAADGVPDVGPIPVGLWHMGEPVDTLAHGPFVLPLTPDPLTDTKGRSGFLVHGDSISHPGFASHGCIVIERSVREEMAASGDNLLEVII